MQREPSQPIDDDDLTEPTRASGEAQRYSPDTVEIDPAIWEDQPRTSATRKVGWAPLKTATIPRVVHEIHFEHDQSAPSETRTNPESSRQRLRRLVGIALILVGLVGVQSRLDGELDEPFDPSSQPAQTILRSITLISTEPPGAELSADGRVFGRTPIQVPRPAAGEKLYVLRLAEYESQPIKLTSNSSGTIQITLLPVAGHDHPHVQR